MTEYARLRNLVRVIGVASCLWVSCSTFRAHGEQGWSTIELSGQIKLSCNEPWQVCYPATNDGVFIWEKNEIQYQWWCAGMRTMCTVSEIRGITCSIGTAPEAIKLFRCFTISTGQQE